MPRAAERAWPGRSGSSAPGPAEETGAGAGGAEPLAERRLVSVLFVDLVGFTPFSEARDHEEVRELLSRYFDRCRVIVERYGGVVEKFIGDAVLAIWGAPATHEDDAERAVRAALEVLEAVSELGQAEGIELQARAGVLTGEAAISHGLYEEGRVTGDLVNTASRLQTSAEPGAVVVGEATYHAASGAVAFAELGELTLKGKDAPVRAWRALRVVAQRKGVGRSEGLEPPFVGRAEELRALKDALDAIGRERRPRLVSVTGIPGIGKSRLAWEFLKYVDGLVEGVFWHQGRSPAYGEGITFWALGEMVRMRAGISEGEDPASSRDKLAASIAEFASDEEDRRFVGPRLSHLLGLAEAPPGGREELFAAWRRFFELIAERDPVVMVFEDLQWADPGLIDFVESILEWSRHSPILVVTLARPELTERRASWGAGQRNFNAVHLVPLPEPAMRELLKGLVHELPERLLEQVLSRAEGVPLYAVETVRMLLDKGLLAERDGGYELRGEWSELAVPDSLRALIASRLDALEPAEAALLRDAAVLGQSFTSAGLGALAGAPPASPELEGRLRSLVRKELLSLDADPRSPGRGQYGFVQSLMREVSYSMLARRDRLSKHLAAAAWFESLGEEELSGVVATHYVAARQAALDEAERESLAELAKQSLARAGERALSLGSPEQALAYLEQALELAGPSGERARLLELAGESAVRAAEYERAVALFDEAVTANNAAGNLVAAGRVIALEARPLGLLDRYSEVISRAAAALEALGDGDDAAHARVRCELSRESAWALIMTGDVEGASAHVERALALAEQIDDQQLFMRAIGRKFLALGRAGRLREAEILARAWAELAESAGDLVEQSRALLNTAVIRIGSNPRASLDASLRGAAIARTVGVRHLELTALQNAAEFAVNLGDTALAKRLLAESAEPSMRGGALDAAYWAAISAALTALTGDPAAGMELLAPFVDEAVQAEFVDARTSILVVRAFVALLAGDLTAARRDATTAVEIEPLGSNSPPALAIACRAALWQHDLHASRAARSSMNVLHGRWMTALRTTADAGIAALEERDGDAAALFGRAAEEWRALESPLDLAFCLLDEVVLLGSDVLGEELLGELGRLLEEIGTPPLVAVLEGALAAEPRRRPSPPQG